MMKPPHSSILLFVICLLFSGEYAAHAQPDVELLLDPDIRTIALDAEKPEAISIIVRTQAHNAQFTWQLTGEGKLEGEGPGVLYVPPATISTASEQVTISVTVTGADEQTTEAAVTFTLTHKPSKQEVSAPENTASEGGFSLADLKAKAEWQKTLKEMEEAYEQVNAFEQDDIGADIKREAWERFVQYFTEDNPFSERDNALRRHAEERIAFWKEQSGESPTPVPVPEPTATPIPVPTATPIPEPPATPTPTPTETPVPTPTPSRVEQLLETAETYIQNDWLTTGPDGKNAFDVYKEILKLDPFQTEAKAKLHDIMNRYKSWGDAQTKRGNTSKAETFYERYLSVADYLLNTIGEQEIKQQYKEIEEQLAQLAAKSDPAYSLRSKPLHVSYNDFKSVFRLDDDKRPVRYIENDFEIQGEVVIDHATGLTWQQAGSPKYLNYHSTRNYITRLNRERFGGYSDWRLPTIDELLSLMERTRQNGKLYINPIFEETQKWCWSSDSRIPSTVLWVVYFNHGYVSDIYVNSNYYVRAVRP